MLLNTKQVRALGKEVIGYGAQWTEKTYALGDEGRRSVIWECDACFGKHKTAREAYTELREKFAQQGIENEITITQDVYVRVKANIA